MEIKKFQFCLSLCIKQTCKQELSEYFFFEPGYWWDAGDKLLAICHMSHIFLQVNHRIYLMVYMYPVYFFILLACRYIIISNNQILISFLMNVILPYFFQNTLPQKLNNDLNQFIVLSLNCQSLNAKFDNILIFFNKLKQNNILFSALCFQETWFGDSTDLTLYQIENYICISRSKQCSEHGGLAVYLHQKYNFENLDLFINSDFGNHSLLKF